MGRFKMENDRLVVTIDDLGAELVSIYDKKYSRELIWQGDPAWWKRQAPILFPNVGKFYGGEYLYQGRHYVQDQHGFARDYVLERVEESPASVTHRLVSNVETRKVYPFDFELMITHRLDGDKVDIQWQVKNTGDHPMHFTIGGHPGFNVPVLQDTEYSDYALKFAEDQDELHFIHIDMNTGTGLPDKVYTMTLTDHKYQLRKHLFDLDALVFDAGQIRQAGIVMPDGSDYLTLLCDGFPNFGIWAAPGAPFVCLEPWCGRCDNFGYEGELQDKPGINSLNVDETFKKVYSIVIGG